MSIVYENDVGYFVCHNQFVLEESCGRFYKKELFDLRTPFFKDLEAAAEAKALELGVARTRKRKKKREVKETPIEESTVKLFISSICQSKSFFQSPPTPNDLLSNNKPAREAVTKFLSSQSTLSVQDASLTCKLSNPSDKTVIELIWDQPFLLPPNCEFYKQDIGDLNQLTGRVFSLITIDPPWANRFIKRKRKTFESSSYHTMDNSFLATLPVAELCIKGTVVAIWCTNSPTHLDYLLNTLLPCWGLTYMGTWFWIKVTTSGAFCVPWNGPSGKQPFERLIIARRLPDKEHISIPDQKLVVSVPSAIHSFKPPLQKLLQPFLVETETTTHLELFARSLLRNTVSWGDQVPLLQHVDLFDTLLK